MRPTFERCSGDFRHNPSPQTTHPPGTVAGVTPGVEALLQGLTEPQQAAVLSDAAPLCVLAAAGSGKTRVLTRRVARRILDGSAEIDHVQVVTFTRKAAGELRSRLGRLGVGGPVRAGTFHAVAYAQLRQYWADKSQQPWAVVDSPARLLRRILADTPGNIGASGSSNLHSASLSIAAEVSWAQAQLLSPDDYVAAAQAAGRSPAVGRNVVAETYNRYLEDKRKRRVLDLDDLLDRCARLVQEDSIVAAAQRWRLRHLFVDELQDVNPAQWRLLMAWLGDRDDLFVVGDPDQAIYSWNGSDPTLLDRLPILLPKTEVLRLDTNYRCSPQVLTAARAVLANGPGKAGGSDVATGVLAVEGAASSTYGQSSRSSGNPPIPAVAAAPDGPLPHLEGFDDELAEAQAVARWLRIAHRPGRPWSHLAILARSNARLLPVAEALRRSEIPFRMRGTANGDDPARDVILRSLRQLPGQLSLRSALADLLTAPAPSPDSPQGAGHSAALSGLGAAADELAMDEPDPSVGSFLSWLTAAGDGSWDYGGESDRVELATFHRAKGLEWPAVGIVGLEDGLVPIGYATTPEALAEECRLLYVAITRAEEDLWCSWANSRTNSDGGTRACSPSPYVALLQAAGQELRKLPDTGKSARRVAELRSRLLSIAV